MFNLFQNKPFNFESFRTQEEVEVYLNNRYLYENIAVALQELSLIGVDCKQVIKKHSLSCYPDLKFPEKHKNTYSENYSCVYYNSWMSLRPFIKFSISMLVDDYQHIFAIFVKKKPSWK